MVRSIARREPCPSEWSIRGRFSTHRIHWCEYSRMGETRERWLSSLIAGLPSVLREERATRGCQPPTELPNRQIRTFRLFTGFEGVYYWYSYNQSISAVNDKNRRWRDVCRHSKPEHDGEPLPDKKISNYIRPAQDVFEYTKTVGFLTNTKSLRVGPEQ